MPAKTAVVAAISAPLFAVAALAAVAGAIAAHPTRPPPRYARPGSGGAPADTENLSSAQLANAQIIAEVGVSMGVPMPGETIAIATALQESDLQNLDYGDRDSLGLFQQRPSQGWGTPAEIMTPELRGPAVLHATAPSPRLALDVHDGRSAGRPAQRIPGRLRKMVGRSRGARRPSSPATSPAHQPTPATTPPRRPPSTPPATTSPPAPPRPSSRSSPSPSRSSASRINMVRPARHPTTAPAWSKPHTRASACSCREPPSTR